MTLLSAAEVYGVSPYPTTVTHGHGARSTPADHRLAASASSSIPREHHTPLDTLARDCRRQVLISTPELTMLDGHRYGSEDKDQSGQVEPNDEIPSSHMGRASGERG